MGLVQQDSNDATTQQLDLVLPGAPTAGNVLAVWGYNAGFSENHGPSSMAAPISAGTAVNNKSAGTSLATFVTNVTIPAGALIIVRAASDNTGAGTTSEAPTHTISGGGLTWTNRAARGSGSASAAGVVGSIHTAPAPSGLASGSGLTLTVGTSTTAKCMDVWYIPNAQYAGVTAVEAGATSGAMTATIDPGGYDRMVIGMIAREDATGAAFTQDSDLVFGPWENMTGSGTTGSTANTNVSIVGGFKRVSKAGNQTYNPTVTNAGNDWVEFLIVVEPVDRFTLGNDGTRDALLQTDSVTFTAFWHKKVTNSTDTVILLIGSAASRAMQGWVGEYDDIPTPVVVDEVDNNGEAGSSTTYTAGPTATTSEASARAFAGVSTGGDGGATVSWSDSFTEVYSGDTSHRLAVATKTLTSTGTPQTTRTWTNALISHGIIVVVKTTAGSTPITDDDTGSGADAVTRIALSNIEAASGADAAAIAASLTTADAGSGLDAGVVVFIITSSDTGGGLDAVTRIAASNADTGSGLDAVTRIGLSNTEAASGLDAAAIAASPTTADAGSGDDAVTRIALSNTDTGSGTEGAPMIAAPIPSSDTGSGADAVSGIGLSNAEAASGSDAQAIAASPTTADAGSGDEGTPKVALTNTDTGSGVENTPLIGVPQSSTDTGSGADAPSRIGTAHTDSGSGLDAGQALAALAQSDEATGADVAAVLAAVAHADTGLGDEAEALLATITDDDTGTGTDDGVVVAGPAIPAREIDIVWGTIRRRDRFGTMRRVSHFGKLRR